jgi:hypothetical protein
MDIKLKNNVTIKIADEIQEYGNMIQKMSQTVCSTFKIKNVNISIIFFKDSKINTGGSTFKESENNYIIYFNIYRLSKMRFTELFLHEFKHIEQYANKKLQDTPSGHIWKKKFFSKEYASNPDNYESLPWEKESFKVEYQWNKIINHMDSKMITKIRNILKPDFVLSA